MPISKSFRQITAARRAFETDGAGLLESSSDGQPSGRSEANLPAERHGLLVYQSLWEQADRRGSRHRLSRLGPTANFVPKLI